MLCPPPGGLRNEPAGLQANNRLSSWQLLTARFSIWQSGLFHSWDFRVPAMPCVFLHDATDTLHGA